MNNITVEYLNYHRQFSKKYGRYTLILMMVGSFYELYSTKNDANGEGPDLQEVSQLLNIICTRKDKKNPIIDTKNPYMIGFPLISSNKFINILIDNGYTLVIIDQVTPPPNPKRQVTHIYSPGTCINNLQKPDYNFVSCIYLEENIQKNGKYLLCSGMSAIDITTGKCYYHEAYSLESDDKFCLDECLRFLNGLNPIEIIIFFKEQQYGLKKDDLFSYLELQDKKNVYYKKEVNNKYSTLKYQIEYLKKVYPDCGQFNPIEYLEMEKYIYALPSLILLMDFIYDHNNKIIDNLNKPELYFDVRNLVLGNNAVHQLNIIDNNSVQTGTKFSSLFSVVNQTSTPLGRRFLKDRITSPIVSHLELNKNYDCIDEMLNNNIYIDIEKVLKEITDIERLEHKIPMGYLHPYEFAELIDSYDQITILLSKIKNYNSYKSYLPDKNIIDLQEQFKNDVRIKFNFEELKKHNLTEITTNIFNKGIYADIDLVEKEIYDTIHFIDLLKDALLKYVDDANSKKKNKDIDNFIGVKKNERDGHYLYITKLRSNILKKNLAKVKTIDVNGFILDPSKLVFKDNNNNTKIIFPELEEKSEKIFELENKIKALNMSYYIETLAYIYKKYSIMFKAFNKFVAYVDFIKSNAKTAKMYGYSRPIIDYNTNNSFIECEKLRHPIVERIIDHEYIPQNISIGKDLKGILLYGLNSSGKSINMKSLGICTIMAQSGMFVPCEKCKFSPYKSLFTRITGNDNLFKGLSSFTLEMLELKAILKRAGCHTLVIGDEVCRGTEHISGNAIVASTIINLSKLGASFIFATHLHEIAQMEKIKNIKNIKPFHLSVRYDSKTDSLIYDRQLKEGQGESIYGITVAKYIIDDKDFVNLALEIKNDLLQDHGSLISGKTSKYNSDVFVHQCQLCLKKDIKGHISNLQTHHINFQKNCEDGLVKNNKHIRKNDKSNLLVICTECHDNIHHKGLEIDKVIMTSNGKKIQMKNNN